MRLVLPGAAPVDQPAVMFWVYDATAAEIRGYVNGQRVASVAKSVYVYGSESFRIGGYEEPLPDGARLDEFRMYQRALSDAEIAAIGGAGTTGPAGPSDPGSDRYRLTLTAGQSIALVTETPFDTLPTVPFPRLDPQLAVLRPDGTPLVLNRDSAADGRNAIASFLVPESGEYQVRVLPETGSGAYVLRLVPGARLTLVLDPNAVSEHGGAAAVTGTVFRNTPADAELTVTLQAGSAAVTVPASVVIPAGQMSAEFAVGVADNALLDGARRVTLSATAAGHTDAATVLEILDDETLTVSVAADEVAENDGDEAATATVTRSNLADMTSDLVVQLTSSQPVVRLPDTVTIPAGQASVAFGLDTVDNGVLDGNRTVTIAAAAAGYLSVPDTLVVTDPVYGISGRVFEDLNGSGAQDAGEAGLAGLSVYLDADDNGRLDAGERTATTNADGDYLFQRVPSGRRVVRQALAPGWTATSPSRVEPVFDVDFDDQAPGPVLTQPNSDRLPLTKPTNAYVSGRSKLEVVAAAADLTQQPVSMEAVHDDPTTFVSTYVQLRPPEGRNRGVLTARWRSAVLGPPTAADWTYIQIAPARDAGGVYNGVSIYYDASGRFRVEAGTVRYVGEYQIGQSDAFALTVDLNTDTYDLLVNGTLLSTGALQYGGDSVYRLWFRSFLYANPTGPAPPLVVDDIHLDWVANDPGRFVDVVGAPVSDQNFGIARPLALEIVAASVPENAGTGARTAAVNRGSLDIAAPLEVTLQSSDITEAMVPASVTIAAGESSVQFSIDVLDDALLDGPLTVTITASAAGYLAAAQTLTVLDHETLTVTIAAEEVAENDGAGVTTATVTRSNTDDLTSVLTVSLTSSHATVQVPATVTIPAGQPSVAFDLDAVDNGVLDGLKTVTLTAAGVGYFSVTDSLVVTDPVSTLSGRVFADPNANGLQDIGEAGSADLTVYLDANDNGQWDTGEPTATTNDQGDYTFSRVPAGRRVVRQLLPAGWVATVPAPSPTVVFDVDFNQQPLGAVLTQSNTDPWPLGRPTSVTTSYQSTAAVVAAAGNLLDQPVLLSGATTSPYLSYARIKLDIPPGPAAGVLNARWKAAVTEMPAIGGATMAFNGYLDETTYNNAVWVRYDSNGKLYVVDGTGWHAAGTFTPGTADEFDLTVDIPADTYTLQVNGRQAAAGALYYAMLRAGDLQFSSQVYYGQPGVAPPLVVDDISILWQPRDAGHSVDVNGGIPVTGLNFGIGRPVTLALAAVEVREDSGPGAVNATISRGTLDTTSPVNVTLYSSDTSEAVVPASVTIPVGESSVQFTIDVRDDALLDGPQTVTITAAAAGYLAAAQTLTVLDHETLTLMIAADQIAESDGTGATTAILSRSNVDDLGSPLVVTLTSSDGMVLVPGTVEIPAGQASVSLAVDTWNNRLRDGRRTATITATAPGYEDGADEVEVIEPDVIIAPSGVGTYVAEGGGGDSYTVVLAARPTADVVVQLQAGAQVQARDQAQPLNAFLTFTPDNWNVPQVVAVSAVNDSAREGPHQGTIAHTVTSANPQYDDIPADNVVAQVLDDDEAPPVANHDLYAIPGGETLVVAAAPAGLLANDTDADGDALTARLVDRPFHGSVALSPDGSFTYVPAPEFRGEDRFTYVAHDGLVDSLLPATVTIRVETPRLVKDISHLPAASNPQNLVKIDGIVYFTATDFEHGTELWRTDGTPAGTWIVKDIVAGPAGSSPTGLVELDGELYFGTSAYSGLWKSDGTAAGTVVVASASWWPSGLVRVGSVIYFQSSGSTHGYELWRSDGTAAGTTLVKDINPGSANSSPRNLLDVNGILFFTATTGENGEELWRSDGTAAGTWLVKDIRPGSNSSSPAYLTNVGGTVFLRAYDGVTGYELWKSDGSDAGTVLVKDIYPGGSSSSPAYLAELNGLLYFQAYASSGGYELWRSDGTDAGTSLWKDINPSGSSYPAYLVNMDGTLYFQATDGVTGTELWKSDGTAGGTVRVADINPGGGSSSPMSFVTVNGTILFSADEGIGGRELWRTDNSALGTTRVADLYSREAGANPTQLVGFADTLLFAATEPATGTELWISDGTTGGTTLVKDIQAGSGSPSPYYLTRVGNVAYFYGYDSTNGYELWRTDGTAAGTWLVKNINSSGSSYPAYLTNVNGVLYFKADDGASGAELWRSDGTAVGTYRVKDILVGSGSSAPSKLINVQGTLFFVANDGIHGEELWKSDGTEAGTTLVKDVLPGSGSASIAYLTCVGDRVYFRASDGVHGSELWVSDGTDAGTTLAKDINPGGNSSYPDSLAGVGSALYFQADDGVHGYELWRSDGTDAGTTLVKDIYAYSNYSSSPSSLTNINGMLYFQAYTSERGSELWKSDGTEAGTVQVKDIAAGTASSWPAKLTNLGDVMFFTATTPEHGTELWRSDGTSEGTVLAGDLAPGPAGSTPDRLTVVGTKLYFTAEDGTTGRELWIWHKPLPEVSVRVAPASVSEDGSGQLMYTLTRSGPTDQAVTVTFGVMGTAAFPSDYTVSGADSFGAGVGTVTFAADSTTAVVTVAPIADDEVEENETVWLQLLAGADYAVGSPADATGTIGNDDTGTLIVTQFTATASGFTARFGRDLEPSVLNLYDSASQELGPADATVTGATRGPVHGSLVVSADQRWITFVQTGGLLAPDTYTVTLSSGATRFRDTGGGALDGNADGTTGDDYQNTFTVSALPAGTVTISLPDVARGAGQAVNVPNTATGLPIRLDTADGLASLAVDVVYDSGMLQITAATLAAGVPADWSVALDTAIPGVAKITASGTTPLSGTDIDFVRLTAAVPSTAPYGAVQAIRLENISLNEGAIAAVGDVAVHKAVYLGDADGSGIHSSADAFLTVQGALGLASGFAAHAWTDPRIVGDADGSGVLSAADAFLIVQEGLGLVEPFVPDNPHITVTPVGGGVDPQFWIDANLPASVGGVVIVPVKLDIEAAATNVGAIEFDLFFDPSQLTIQVPDGVSAGADTAGWAVTAKLVASGHLRVGMVSSSGQPLAVGLREIARLQFRVEDGKSRRTGWQPVPDGLPTRPTWLPPITDHRLPITDVLDGSETQPTCGDGSETYPTWLDIEPVDPRAGGYTWTDADGSVLIQPAERAPVGATRERVWRDVDAKADLLESVLADLVHELASAWR